MTDEQAAEWINSHAPAELRWWIHDRLRSLASAPCSRLVLQRRYIPNHWIPKPLTEWHDHPEPSQIAWEPGQFASVEENMRRACRDFYEFGKSVEYRMVRRTDEAVWEYSANVPSVP